MSRIRIFIDTNQVWDNKGPFSTIFSPSFSDLPKFLKDNSLKKISICLPDMVIKERVQHKKESINEAIKYVNEKIKILKEAGHEDPEIEPRDDYERKLRKYAEEFCGAHAIEIISDPSVTLEELTEWATSKRKPFDDHGSGFKDTLIYLSMVEDAKANNGDTYILATKNSTQFDEELISDFKERTGKELSIVPGILEVQQKLDELVPLGQRLVERDQKIENIIGNHTGTLVTMANTTKNDPFNIFTGELNITGRPDPELIWSTTSAVPQSAFMSVSGIPVYASTVAEPGKIIGYDFSSFEISSISEIEKDKYKVRGRLNTYIKRDTDAQFTFYPTFRDTKDFDFTVMCDLTDGSMKIVDFS